MAVRFLILFAATNTLAVGALSAFISGGAGSTAAGFVLAPAALAGAVATGRIVVVARPARRRDARELRQLRRDLGKGTR